MAIFLTIIGINVAILVGFLLGALVAAPSKSDRPQNVGTLYIYKDTTDNVDHIYADFNMDIPTIKDMKVCEFRVDNSLHIV